MSRSSSDAAVEIVKVGRDGIRLRIGHQLHLPVWGRDEPPAEAPAENELTFRLTVASPPPDRGDQTWDSGAQSPNPEARAGWSLFDPAGEGAGVGLRWQAEGVNWADDVPLNKPDADTIILSEDLNAPFQWAREMSFRPEPEPLGFLSRPYEQPFDYNPEWTSVGVNYFAEYTLPFSRPLKPGDWLAFAIGDFTPPNRKSADFLAQVQDANLFHPPSWRSPQEQAQSSV